MDFSLEANYEEEREEGRKEEGREGGERDEGGGEWRGRKGMGEAERKGEKESNFPISGGCRSGCHPKAQG